MKTVKTAKMCCALVGAATVLAAPNLLADIEVSGTLTLERAFGNQNGGGAFVAATSGLGTFDTFCLGSQVEFTDGNTYNYTTSSTIQPASNPTINPTFVTLGTAWIYSTFRYGGQGAFAGESGNTLNQFGIDVQNAIWLLQGQEFGANNAIITDAENALGLNLTGLEANGNGADGVEALDLTIPGTSNYAQPQLAIVPEASTVIAGAMLLLPMGVSALRIVRKNRVA